MLQSKPTEFYKPILFKRWQRSKWEEGILVVNQYGETIFNKNKDLVTQVYKYKSNWF